MRLKALKSLRYNTRRLLPGDVFEAKNNRDRKILLATRKVESVEAEPAPAAAPSLPDHPNPPPLDDLNPQVSPPAGSEPSVDERAALRAQYEAAVGKKPFPGWDAETLREKIAAAASAGK